MADLQSKYNELRQGLAQSRASIKRTGGVKRAPRSLVLECESLNRLALRTLVRIWSERKPEFRKQIDEVQKQAGEAKADIADLDEMIEEGFYTGGDVSELRSERLDRALKLDFLQRRICDMVGELTEGEHP